MFTIYVNDYQDCDWLYKDYKAEAIAVYSVNDYANLFNAEVNRISMFHSTVNDPKRIWHTAKQLLHTTKSDNVSDDDCASMCNKLSLFFCDKVNRARAATAAVIKCAVNPDNNYKGAL